MRETDNIILDSTIYIVCQGKTRGTLFRAFTNPTQTSSGNPTPWLFQYTACHHTYMATDTLQNDPSVRPRSRIPVTISTVLARLDSEGR